MPPARASHVAWPAVQLDGYSIFGGEPVGGASALGDFWQFSFAKAVWQPVPYNNVSLPSARWGHSIVALPDGELFIYGGVSGSTFRTDLWHRELVGDCDLDSFPVVSASHLPARMRSHTVPTCNTCVRALREANKYTTAHAHTLAHAHQHTHTSTRRCRH